MHKLVVTVALLLIAVSAEAAPAPSTAPSDPLLTEAAQAIKAVKLEDFAKSVESQLQPLLVVLDHLSQSFEPGRHYPEKDVNEILEHFHPDYAALRRYLVEDQFLTREEGVYWRSGGTFDV